MQNFFYGLNRTDADLVLLILESQGINADSVKTEGTYDIIVRTEDLHSAQETLEKYYAENFAPELKQPQYNVSWRSYTGLFIISLLCFVHFYAIHHGIHENLIKEYGSSGLYIMNGEYYRSVTALFLHSDAQHLAGNLLGMFIFATGVFSLTGYGRGSLMILLSGLAGNIATAYFKKGVYLSIGASTSVLGAAGILTALQIVKKKKTSMGNIQILAPFAAGMALLGFLSGGENTDMAAHLFGFFWGLILGFFYALLIKKHEKAYDNILCSGIAILIIISAALKYF